MAAFGLLGVVAIVVLAIAWIALLRTGLAKGPVADDTLHGLGVLPDADTRVLVGRWRDRARRWRALGGLPLATAVVAFSLGVRNELRIGLGGAPVWSDPLLMGLLGAFAGAIGAELHHLRRRPRGPRTVSLEPRELHAFLPERARVRLAVVVGLAAVGSVLHLVLPAVEGVPVPGLLAGLVTAAVVGVQRAIVTRPRPALPDTLAAADDAVRRLAIRSVDASGAGAVLLLSLWQASTVSHALLGEPDQLGLIVLLMGGLYLAVAVVALVWWWRGGPMMLIASATRPDRRVEAAS